MSGLLIRNKIIYYLFVYEEEQILDSFKTG